MSFQVDVKFDHVLEKFYFRLTTPFNSFGVYTHYKQTDILENKENKKFFFDAIFNPEFYHKSPDEVCADHLYKPMLTVTALLQEQNEMNSNYDVMLSVHQNNKTNQRVLFLDFPDYGLEDKRTLLSGRNIYKVPENYQISKYSFEELFYNNSHKQAGNRLSPIVQNDDLANKDDYYVVEHKSYKFFFI
jgi:hypothetical protein